MYHLLQSLYLHATSKPEYSILLLGLDNAGKTTLLEQIKALYSNPSQTASQNQKPIGQTVPTVGQNVSVIDIGDCYLRIWDVGGQQSLRGLWENYYSSCHAIVFVVDSTDLGNADASHLTSGPDGNTNNDDAMLARGVDDEGRLSECAMVLNSILSADSASGVPLLVLANKQDREDCVEVVRIKEGFVRKVFEGEKGQSVRDSRVLPCSALKGVGVREAG